MARTLSTMMPLGTRAPDFTLPNTNPDYGGDPVSLADFASAKALLVVFMCNHCPFVVHIREALRDFVARYQARGLVVVAISANDITTHPDDSPDRMTEDAGTYGYTFPYLYDESQAVAKAYGAACTPDFFLFDSSGSLFYRGRFDGATPGNQVAVTGADLSAAVDQLLVGGEPPVEQLPSMGCNIKWKAGEEPEYYAAG